MKRRRFVGQVGAGALATLLPQTTLAFEPALSTDSAVEVLKFGMVTDVHKDLMPDTDKRLETFIEKAIYREADFIIQVGDFRMTEPQNKGFLKIWNAFKSPKHHILGNHDMDRQSKTANTRFPGNAKTYYS